jgi:hypothetical protein
MTKDIIHVRCTNLLCLGPPFRAEFDKKDPKLATLKTVVCPHCGNVGAMGEDMVLSGDEILRQVECWRGKVLYRDAFRAINYKKLPVTILQQRFKEKIKHAPRQGTAIDRLKRTPIKRGGIDERKRA